MTIISLLKATVSLGIFIILSWVIFHFAGAFWGVAWLVLCAFLLAQLNKNDTKNG